MKINKKILKNYFDMEIRFDWFWKTLKSISINKNKPLEVSDEDKIIYDIK